MTFVEGERVTAYEDGASFSCEVVREIRDAGDSPSLPSKLLLRRLDDGSEIQRQKDQVDRRQS
ncbi:hypothetical protein [Streptomyces prunicolor]|uniref:hypothetical protein n=1 Tax=Streptomyces prunicolor TaxID=67348 RepID=UPI00340D6C81